MSYQQKTGNDNLYVAPWIVHAPSDQAFQDFVEQVKSYVSLSNCELANRENFDELSLAIVTEASTICIQRNVPA